jgi:hypothetical protein
MRTLPTEMIRVFAPFAPLFSERVFRHVQVLLMGAILAPGPRKTDGECGFESYGSGPAEELPSLPPSVEPCCVVEQEGSEPSAARAPGGSLRARRRTAGCRRRRDPAAPPREEDSCQGDLPRPGAFLSSGGHFVKTRALRWACLTLLAAVPWTSRVWALPFLSVLAPSERHAKEECAKEECAKRHKPLTERAWQMLLLVSSKALVPQTPDRRGRRRWRVCLIEALGPLPETQEAHRLHHPPS